MKTDLVDDVLIINLPARLDAAGIAAIEHELAETVNQHRGKVLADMSEVNFVASLALRMLLTNLRSVQSYGGDLRLCHLQPQIAEIFRKSRFDTLFKIYPDRESALAAYRSH
ncbi:MAG: STAS domain-containing protein [Chloroflexus sp.]|nr:STAS domain-containing protein [Chloroflexus sp.]MBO9318899.1 STAS domain-containing protein [Chloroflexus sp.]MBO9372838.1 STAS domain-containing protein [Chloroflexus sp.]